MGFLITISILCACAQYLRVEKFICPKFPFSQSQTNIISSFVHRNHCKMVHYHYMESGITTPKVYPTLSSSLLRLSWKSTFDYLISGTSLST